MKKTKKRIVQHSPKAIDTHTVIANMDAPLLSESLKPAIEESLAECGKDHCRKGTILTPMAVVLVVLGLAIRRDLSYPAVLDWLVSKVRWLTCYLPKKLISDGALSHARNRIGVDVFRRLFQKMVTRPDALPKDFHGLTSTAFDGVTVTMPDTEDNKKQFGIPSGKRGPGGYPQLRMLSLLIVPIRQIADIAYGPYKGKGTGEASLLKTLIERLAYSDLLHMVDAGLYSFNLLLSLKKMKNNQHLLAKLSAKVKPKRLPGKRLWDGSYLATVGKGDVTITVRIIEYQIPGFRSARLLTTLLDPTITARELVIHYHRRWDIEIAFDEIKTHQCATLRGQMPTILRSKTPDLVEQELYAVVVVYNLVRDLIYQAVGKHHTEVPQISFLESLQCSIDAIPYLVFVKGRQAAKTVQYLLSLIAECLIDRPCRNRINPRVVKVKMSKFGRKRDIHTSSHRDLENELEIIWREEV